MDQGIVDRVRDWDSQPFSGGYAGLHELAEREFTGAVERGGTWLFMLNGRAVGLFDGEFEAFESGDGTVYEAPHPGLPLLFTMQTRGGETKARYYTDDTPLSEVNSTLAEAGFTGYLELSENVLSGDYYLVYYGGRSMSLAFIGNAGRVVTGDEAFSLADEEVGIYEVRTVDVEVIDLPGSPGGGEPSGGQAEAADGDPTTEPSHAGDDPVDEESEPVEEPEGESTPTGPEPTEGGDDASTGEPGSPGTGPPEPPVSEAEPPTHEPPVGDQRARLDTDEQSRPSPDPFSEEEQWRETTTIPALDPEESEADRPEHPDEAARPPSNRGDAARSRAQPNGNVESRVEALESALDERSAELDQLRDQVASVTAERDRLREERDEFERRLAADDDAPTAGTTSTGGTQLDADTAIVQTDLFIRYGSKGGATLEKAHDGNAERSAVTDNLRLEHHTRFEADGASVEGRPFEDFLTGTIGYRFVRWVVEALFYEIKDTDNRRALGDLFDAIPRIDRAEFRGEITATDEAGDSRTYAFDVVCRDRMGKPLLVANINDARDPATGEMTADLVEGASDVATSFDSLAGAFLVTSSFFAPDALEETAEATGSGLLGRDRRKSFVKLSRKSGFHLSLVEARGDAFHVAVPEL